MLKILLAAPLLLFSILSATCQADTARKSWTEADRRYLLDNLGRNRQLLIEETAGLTPAQWTFHESPGRWSIAEIIEHLSYWELIYTREVDVSLRQKPHPEWIAKPDSGYVSFLNEEAPHIARSYVVPLGLNEGRNNMALLLKLRDSAIAYIRTTKQDLRSYYINMDRPNVHQTYINIFGHCDRHLKQIRKVKAHPAYPSK